MQARIKIKRVGAVEVPLPRYQTSGSAGMDLCAALSEPIELRPGQRHLIPTGLCLEIEPGFEGQVRPRSGLALRHGLTVLNTPGTVDADYRGEVGILLINHGSSAVEIKPLERIAQLVIAPVISVQVELCMTLSDSSRDTGGYGSTGT
jgi:dUTP pyrophosphatase